MRSRLTFLLFALFFSNALFSQSSVTIQGTVVDSLTQSLSGATVVLMNQSDSVMMGFGVTSEKGQFSLKSVKPGEYILQISFLGFQTEYQPVSIKGKENVKDMGEVVLFHESTLLDEVLVAEERIPIAIKNDTIEYDARAFKTTEGSKVEDLLKKLPGVEVDRDGNVRAQGEAIDKVLVDGKEFFGNDPKIATKNLPADAVDKVQVFDKQSEMAEFSGIEDGMEQKTINLELKEDKKNGYFGDLEAGYGTEDRYSAKGNLNRFGQKSQFSLIGMSNNINEQGFSLNDYLNFMGGIGNIMGNNGSGGSMTLNLEDSGLPMNLVGQDGIMTTHAGGINFNRDISKRTTISANYFFNQSKNRLSRETFREQLLDGSQFSTQSESDGILQNTNHRINLTMRHQIDSFQRITYRTSLGNNNSQTDEHSQADQFDQNDLLRSSNSQKFNQEDDLFNWRNDLTYLRRFRKKGRALTARAAFALRDNDGSGDLLSENIFWESQITDTINQNQEQSSIRNEFGGRISYTEPLGKSRYLELSYAHQLYSNETEKSFYDIVDGEGILNELLSRSYEQDYSYDQAGIKLRRNHKNSQLTIGANLQWYRLTGQLRPESAPIKDTNFGILPNLRWRYEFSQSSSVRFNYNTNIQQPSLQQLQPLVDNSNPLRLYIGNPELSPEYSHRINLDYMSFSQFSMINVFANVSGTYTRDKITDATTVDENLRQLIQPLNIDEDYTLNGYFSFGAPLRFMKSRINLNVNHLFNRTTLFINDIENKVNRQNTSFGLSLNNTKTELIDIQVGSEISWNQSVYNESSDLNQSFVQYNGYADMTINLGKQMALTSSFDLTRYSQESFGGQETVSLWKASLTRYLFKRKGRLSFSVHDLLNQNRGIQRTSNLNYAEEQRTSVLGRYYMLSFGWSISGFKSNDDGVHINMMRS